MAFAFILPWAWLRTSLNNLEGKAKVSVTHLLVAALARTLSDIPRANSIWDNGEIVVQALDQEERHEPRDRRKVVRPAARRGDADDTRHGDDPFLTASLTSFRSASEGSNWEAPPVLGPQMEESPPTEESADAPAGE